MAQLLTANEIISTLTNAMIDLGARVKYTSNPSRSSQTKVSRIHEKDAIEKQHQHDQDASIAMEIAGITSYDGFDRLPIPVLHEWMPLTSIDRLASMSASCKSLKTFAANRKRNGISVITYARFCQKVSALIRDVSDFSNSVLRSEMDHIHSLQDEALLSLDARPLAASVDVLAEQAKAAAQMPGVYGVDEEDSLFSAPGTPYETPAVSASSSRSSSPPLPDDDDDNNHPGFDLMAPL